jgi:hypothetical protein
VRRERDQTAQSSSPHPGDDCNRDAVLELLGAETLALRSPLKGAARRADPLEGARAAARIVRDHDLDSLQITYPDGVGLSADRT